MTGSGQLDRVDAADRQAVLAGRVPLLAAGGHPPRLADQRRRAVPFPPVRPGAVPVYDELAPVDAPVGLARVQGGQEVAHLLGIARGHRPAVEVAACPAIRHRLPPRARRSSSSAASAAPPRTSPTVAVRAYGCREPDPATAARSCWSRVLAWLLHRMCAARLFRALSRPPSRSGTTWSIDGAHGSPEPSRARSIAVPSGQRHSGIMQTHLSRW